MKSEVNNIEFSKLDKDSIFELQCIDSNCNECAFLIRDIEKFKEWEQWNRELQLKDFEVKKAKAIEDAKKQKPYNEWLVKKAQNLQFQFNCEGLLSYGNCARFNKKVSFIPMNCMPENINCFRHRKISKINFEYKLVGFLTKDQTRKQYSQAGVGHPVYEEKGLYFFEQTLIGSDKAEKLFYYKENLSMVIDFL